MEGQLGDMLEVVDGVSPGRYLLGVLLALALYRIRRKVKGILRAIVAKENYCLVISKHNGGSMLLKWQVGGSARWLSWTIYWKSNKERDERTN